MNNVEAVMISSITSISGTLSVLGSSSIIYMIFSDRERKLGRPYHRLMLLMSCFDVIQSLALVIAPLPLPLESGIYGAKGNSSTCAAQGFLVILGLAVPIYNSGLNIFYMLTIRYNFSSDQFAKYEPAVHATAIIIPFSIAIFGIAKNYMLPRGVVCMPRSPLVNTIVTVLYTTNFFICITTMTSICWKVCCQTSTMAQYTYARRNSSNRTRIIEQRNETIKQAFFYFFAFVLTYIFVCINGVKVRVSDSEPPVALLTLAAIFYPLQGFWNFCFYIRPAVKFVMQTNPNMSLFRVIRGVIFDRTLDIGSPRARRRSLIPRVQMTPSARRNSVRGRNESNDRSRSHDNESVTLCRNPTRVSIKDYRPCEPDLDHENETIPERENIRKVRLQSRDEVCSVLNEHDIAEVSSLNDGIPCEPDGDFENEIESSNETKKKDRRVSLVDIGSILEGEDSSETSSVDITTPYQPNRDLENQTKCENKNERKSRRLSLVETGSVLNDDDIVELSSVDDI